MAKVALIFIFLGAFWLWGGHIYTAITHGKMVGNVSNFGHVTPTVPNMSTHAHNAA